MAERTIRHAAFSYRVEAPDPIRPGRKIHIEKRAYQGEMADIPFQEDIERGEKFGAFVGPQTPAVRGIPSVTEDEEDEEKSVEEMTDEELVSWIQNDRPNVQVVIDAAEGDPEQAKRLLDAEDTATGGDSRQGVIKGLSAIIGNA